MSDVPPEVSKYMREKGAKGGKAKGPSKVRGSKEHYKRLSKLGVAARKRAISS